MSNFALCEINQIFGTLFFNMFNTKYFPEIKIFKKKFSVKNISLKKSKKIVLKNISVKIVLNCFLENAKKC